MRVPAGLLDRLDAWVVDLQAGEGLGVSGITRSDLIRDILTRALDEHEKGRRRKR